MLDIRFIRENAQKVEEAARNKKAEINVGHILHLDSSYRELLTEVQNLQQQRNQYAKERNIEKGKELKNILDKKEADAAALKQELEQELSKIPNIAKDDVKVGKDDTQNDIIKTVGEKPQFSFTPKDHLDLGEQLDIIDTKQAAEVSGARFAYLKNGAVLLEFALVQYALETLIKEGFTPVVPPTLIKKDVMKSLGYMENGGDEDMFQLTNDGLVLVGTAEHALVPLHMNQTLQKKDLPKRYIGFSSAFRREAGSYGKDTRGILRVHQFDKVEMVSFVAEEDDDKEHDYLLSVEEKLFQALEIPYQVVKMCTGDLGFPVARKYDIEAWMPGQQKYREVTSVSTVTDFQSRRLNIKYQDNDEKKFAHVLNGTAFAVGRTIIAILENYQTDNGEIIIPKVLQKYIGKEIIKNK